MTIQKIKIKETSVFDLQLIEGSLEVIIADLQKLKNEGGWCGIEIEYGYYGDPNEYILYKYREETDEEYQKHIERIKWAEEKKEQQKKKRLQNLKEELDSLTEDELKELGLK
jgi:hypothetical protein